MATFAVVIGTGMLTQKLKYQEGVGAKQMAWLLHCSVLGGVIAPLCFLGGPILTRAALYTAGIAGGLSTLAVCAPSDKFLYMGGPLAIGLGLVMASSLAGIWLPPTTALGAGNSHSFVHLASIYQTLNYFMHRFGFDEFIWWPFALQWFPIV